MSKLSEQFDYMDLDDFEEFLADKPRDEKWELIDGRVVRMMVGARWEHHRIIRNIDFALTRRFRASGSDCHTFSETFLMKSKAVESATLPDIMVRCGSLPPGATSFDDPRVIVEVMSRGSVDRDRSEKWSVYRRLASLQHYVLIDRDRWMVDVFDRTGEAWASRRTLESPSAELDLPALSLSVALSEIYAGVLAA